jgi:hypothetical protein
MGENNLMSPWTQRFVLIVLAFMGIMVIAYLALISFYPIPAENTRIVDTTQGFLMGTVLNAVITIFTQFLIPKKESNSDEKPNRTIQGSSN